VAKRKINSTLLSNKIFLGTLFSIWLFLGVYILWFHNDVLPWIYLLPGLFTFKKIAVLNYQKEEISDIYPDSEKLGYYFKNLTFSKITAMFLPAKVSESSQKETLLFLEKMWIILTTFPLFFIIFYADWEMLLLYLTITTIWHITYLKLR
jgi:hypothetical protein